MGTETVIGPQLYPTARRWPRYKLDIPIRVVTTSADKVKLVEGRGNELNEGGLAVNAGVELEVDEIVEIEFTPAYTHQPLRARARVRNRNGYRYGLEFLLETSVDRERMEDIQIALQGVGQMLPN